MSSGDCWWATVQRAPGRAPGSVQNKPCFDLCGRRSRVSQRLQAALEAPSARGDAVWVYVVVVHPEEVLPASGKVPRGALT